MSVDGNYRLLFLKHPVPMWVYDRETHRFLEVNESAIRQYGYTRDEFLAMTIDEIRPPSEIERLATTFDLPNDAPYREMGVWRHQRKDGSILDVEIISTAAAYRGIQARAVVAIDVTDRLRREQERKEAENLLQAALSEHARLLQMAAEAAEQQQRFLRDVLSSVTEGKLRLCANRSELPSSLPPRSDIPPLFLTSASLSQLRRQVDSVAENVGLPLERAHDLIMAVGEAAMNAVVHAGGGSCRLCADPETQIVQVWVEDTGGGIDLRHLPRATLERGYSSGGSLGHGFWMMLRTCDRVYLLTGPEGTTVVLEQERTAPEVDLF